MIYLSKKILFWNLFFCLFFCYNNFRIDGDYMNKKGFTLVELLGVVAILVILTLIIVPIVDKNLKKSKDDMHTVQVENIRLAAENFFSENYDLRPDTGDYCSISVGNLVLMGYLSEDITDPANGGNFGNARVEIKNVGNSKRDAYTYIVCPYEGGCELTVQSCM